MKRGTPRHPKISKLARSLQISKPCAVGTLELLWHFAAEFALDGAIGRYTDGEIADAVCWESDPETLVNGLVDAGWVDRCSKNRLLIHDWKDHADQTVQRVLSKRNQSFAQCHDDASTVLAPSKMPKANTNTNTNTNTSSHEPVCDSELRLTGESINEPEPTPEDVYAAYPLKVGKPAAILKITSSMKRFGAKFILDKTREYAKAINGSSMEKRAIPNPSTWFYQERFNDDPSTWVRESFSISNSNNRIAQLEHKIQNHPRNPECSDYDASRVTPAMTEDFNRLKHELNALRV